MRRRDFLISSAAAVSGAMLGALPGCSDQSAPGEMYDPFEIVPLGNTGIRVSRVGMGTGVNGWERQSDLTRLGAAGFETLLQQVHGRGVRLFDLADLYGTHPYLPQAFRAIPRDQYVLVSKIWFQEGGLPEKDRPPADILVERFLHELKTDYIDLLLLHCVTSPEWNTELSEQMQIMDNLKKKGLLRAHGVSCHSLPALALAAEESWVDSVHTRINAFGEKMDGPPGVVAPVIRQVHDAGKGVVGMKLVGGGEFRKRADKLDYTLKYVLNLGSVDTMIVGFEQVAQLDDFADRVRKVPRAKQWIPVPEWEQAEVKDTRFL